MLDIANIPRDTYGKLPAYAWPGGYPLFYIVKDGEPLCPPCANRENGSLARVEPDPEDPGSDGQWQIVGSDVNWEDHDLTCSHCNQPIPSAYADPK